MRRARNVLCPYCFERWSTRVAAARCLSTDRARCPQVVDEPLGRLLGTDGKENQIMMFQGLPGMAFEPRRGKPVRCRCGAPTYPVCPRCHSRLPQLFTQHHSRSMALIGTRGSGKSHFVVVVLHELERRVGARFNGSLMMLDDHSRRRFGQELVPRLYQHGAVLDATPSAQVDRGVGQPLVARLSLGGDVRRATHTNMVFFDSAGEDLGKLGVLEREARYVTQSDGLILLIDPLQIPSIRDALHGSLELPDVVMDMEAMVKCLVALVREIRGVPAGKPITMPLALALSKLDAIRTLLPEGHPVLDARAADRLFDGTEARRLSDLLRADVAGWLGNGFDSMVRQNFSTFSYFGLSALGAPPVDGRLTHGVAPHRVEDPVLWMLDRWGAMPAKP